MNDISQAQEANCMILRRKYWKIDYLQENVIIIDLFLVFYNCWELNLKEHYCK